MIDVSRGSAQAASYLDITAQELIVGARDKRDIAGIDSLIASYPVVDLDASIGRLAYDLLKRYAKSDGLRTFDSLIAATAMAHGLALVTRNRKHFQMIDGLLVEVPRF